MNKKNISRIAIGVAFAVLFVCIFAFLQALVMPKYTFESNAEGAYIAEYYDEKHDHDILFVGDCEVFENYSPIELWEEYGITSYIRGSGQQLIWQSYYLLEEMLNEETPSAVVYNVQSLIYDEPQDAEFNRLTIDGMKLSATKLKAIKASMTEDEQLITYIFPILRFHSRWSELTADDLKYVFEDTEKVTHSGFVMRSDILSAGMIKTASIPDSFTFGDNAMGYLKKMKELCDEKGVELILVKAPTLPYWYPQWDEQVVEFAKENNLTYINFIDIYGIDFPSKRGYIEYTSNSDACLIVRGEEVSASDLLGGVIVSESDMLDFSVDTYDGGLHLNLQGAEKHTRVFGRIITKLIDFPDHSEDKDLIADWTEKCRRYYDMLADQQYELEAYGYLKSYGAKKPDTTTEVNAAEVSQTDLSGSDK